MALIRDALQRETSLGVIARENQMPASAGVSATLFYRWCVPGSGDRQALLQRCGPMFTPLHSSRSLQEFIARGGGGARAAGELEKAMRDPQHAGSYTRR